MQDVLQLVEPGPPELQTRLSATTEENRTAAFLEEGQGGRNGRSLAAVNPLIRTVGSPMRRERP